MKERDGIRKLSPSLSPFSVYGAAAHQREWQLPKHASGAGLRDLDAHQVRIESRTATSPKLKLCIGNVSIKLDCNIFETHQVQSFFTRTPREGRLSRFAHTARAARAPPPHAQYPKLCFASSGEARDMWDSEVGGRWAGGKGWRSGPWGSHRVSLH